MGTWPAVALLVAAGAFALGQNTKRERRSKKPTSYVDVVEELRKLTKAMRERNELLMTKTVQDLTWEVNTAKDKIIEAFKDELRKSNKGEHDDDKHDDTVDAKCGNVTLKINSTRLEPSGDKVNASFFLFETNSSWSAASAACENGGTELATLSGNVDLADMVAALNKIRPKWSKLWTSGKFDKDNGTWVWGSGDAVDAELPVNASSDGCLALSTKGSLEVFDCGSIMPAYICSAECA